MRGAFFLLIGLLACADALADEDFRCLVSTGNDADAGSGAGRPIRLQFVFPPDEGDTGRVVYEDGSGAIRVKRKSERATGQAPDGRPWAFESVWLEQGPEGGKYIMETQGAAIESFKYVRGKDGKVFHFKPDPAAEGDTGCTWNKPRS